ILIQIGAGGAAVAQTISLVGQAHVAGIGVRVGVDRDAGDAQGFQGTDDSGGDGATVGDQYLLEHDVGSAAMAGRPAVSVRLPGSSPAPYSDSQCQISTSMGVGL